ncbi:MAG TPA: hypothetical protein VFZ65_14285 [Planctomycetota bacterium]|nr:hypothetical protein [Planctomycetota bacterium]
MPRLLSLSCLLLASAGLAQSTIVSPVGTATVDGSGSNSFPFNSNVPRRYMQLHGDIGGSAKLITQLSFRVSSSTANNLGTRIIDVDMYMGEGIDPLKPSYTFDNNYIGGKTLVLPQTQLTFGPQGQAITGVNPFTGNMDIVLANPFVYSGTNSLVWELTYNSQTTGATGTFVAEDAEQGVVTSATSSITGTGCVATGGTAAMTHTFPTVDIAGTLVMNATIAAAPANTLVLLGIGASNPNTPVAGLCGNLYTDLTILQYIGLTDASGALTTGTPTLSTISVPNTLTGVTLYTQAFALDFASTLPLPFTASNGRQVTVPTSDLTRVNNATRIFNNAGGTTATEGIFFTTTIGYSLVTQFTYF